MVLIAETMLIKISAIFDRRLKNRLPGLEQSRWIKVRATMVGRKGVVVLQVERQVVHQDDGNDQDHSRLDDRNGQLDGEGENEAKEG